MGDLFRKEIATGSAFGKEIQTLINAGNLVPDELTIKVLNSRLKEKDCKNGYILDGFPRTMNQTKLLEKIANIDKVIFLNVDFDIVFDRIGGRRNCPKCGHVHNIKFAGDPEKCSVCGSKYIIRADDTREAIEKRLAIFESQTLPIVDYYRQKKLVLDVDAGGSPENSLEQILKGLAK